MGQTLLRPPLPLGRPPVFPAPPARLDASIVEIILRVIGSSLPVEMPLLPPDLSHLRVQVGTEPFKSSLVLGDDRDGRRAKVQSHRALAERMLRLLVRCPFDDEVHPEAGLFPPSRRRTNRTYLTRAASPGPAPDLGDPGPWTTSALQDHPRHTTLSLRQTSPVSLLLPSTVSSWCRPLKRTRLALPTATCITAR